MKKNRILTLILAVIMVLSMIVPMTASAAGENASITITPPASLTLDAADFSAYKLFDLVVSGTAYAYTPTAELNAFLATAEGSAYAADAATLRTKLEAYQIDMKAFTKDLTASTSFTKAGTAAKVGETIVISGVDYGYYLVAGKGKAEGTDVIAHSSLITVDKAANPINLKADAPTIEKFVKNTENTGDTWQKWTDLNIGDTADFKFVSAVPNMTGYDQSTYEFIVHDVISNGLTLADDFATNGVTIKIGDYSFTDFTVDVIDANNFKITFDKTAFGRRTTGDVIEILYSATVNANAVIGAPGNPNEVKLEYSNNPYSTSTGKTPESKVVVYTFGFDIFKYTGTLGASPEALANAKFELKKNDVAINLIDNGDGSYTVAKTAGAGTTTEIVTPASGTVVIKGLDRGVYSLKETAAPAGYHKLDAEVPVEVIHTTADGNWSIKVANVAIADKTVNVLNNTGNKLPDTGGIGTTIFYVVSAILTAGLVAFFVIRRRKNVLDVK